MSQHDYQKYERAKVKNFPDVFLMAFCSILVSCISYPWFDAKGNVLAGNKERKSLRILHIIVTDGFHITPNSWSEHDKR